MKVANATAADIKLEHRDREIKREGSASAFDRKPPLLSTAENGVNGLKDITMDRRLAARS